MSRFWKPPRAPSAAASHGPQCANVESGSGAASWTVASTCENLCSHEGDGRLCAAEGLPALPRRRRRGPSPRAWHEETLVVVLQAMLDNLRRQGSQGTSFKILATDPIGTPTKEAAHGASELASRGGWCRSANRS